MCILLYSVSLSAVALLGLKADLNPLSVRPIPQLEIDSWPDLSDSFLFLAPDPPRLLFLSFPAIVITRPRWTTATCALSLSGLSLLSRKAALKVPWQRIELFWFEVFPFHLVILAVSKNAEKIQNCMTTGSRV